MASGFPGGSLVRSINGKSRKAAASLAHPGLAYALVEFDGFVTALLSSASLHFSPTRLTQKNLNKHIRHRQRTLVEAGQGFYLKQKTNQTPKTLELSLFLLISLFSPAYTKCSL